MAISSSRGCFRPRDRTRVSWLWQANPLPLSHQGSLLRGYMYLKRRFTTGEGRRVNRACALPGPGPRVATFLSRPEAASCPAPGPRAPPNTGSIGNLMKTVKPKEITASYIFAASSLSLPSVCAGSPRMGLLFLNLFKKCSLNYCIQKPVMVEAGPVSCWCGGVQGKRKGSAGCWLMNICIPGPCNTG